MPPASIPTHCSANAQPALQSWLGTVPDRSIVAFSGCYRLDSALRVASRFGLDFKGTGTLKVGPSQPNCAGNTTNQSIIAVTQSSDIRFSGLHLVGNNPKPGQYGAVYYCQHGLNLLASNRIHVEDLTITNPGGDCIYIGGAQFPAGTNKVHADRLTCQSAGREGVSVVHGSHVGIYSSTFDRIGHWAMSDDPNTASDGASDVRFIGNTIVNARVGTVNVGGTVGSYSDIRIIGNTCSVKSCQFYVRGNPAVIARNIVIDSNTSLANLGSLEYVRLRLVRYVTVSHNYLPCPPKPNGGRLFLTIGNSDSVTVTGNTVANCLQWSATGSNTNISVA